MRRYRTNGLPDVGWSSRLGHPSQKATISDAFSKAQIPGEVLLGFSSASKGAGSNGAAGETAVAKELRGLFAEVANALILPDGHGGWTQVVGPQRNQFQNPLRQTHVRSRSSPRPRPTPVALRPVAPVRAPIAWTQAKRCVSHGPDCVEAIASVPSKSTPENCRWRARACSLASSSSVSVRTSHNLPHYNRTPVAQAAHERFRRGSRRFPGLLGFAGDS